MVRLTAALLLAVIVFGCSESPPERSSTATVRDSAGVRIVENSHPLWDEGESWRLSASPSVIIASDGPVPEQLPLDPGSAFLSRVGEIIVADGMFVGWDKLLVFDRDGRYLREQGREGRGPCEFGQLFWACPYRGDSVAAFDYQEHALSIFAPDGTCARDIALPRLFVEPSPGTTPLADGVAGAFADGSIVASSVGWVDIEQGPGAVWARHILFRMSPTGEQLDSLGVFNITQVGWTGSEQVSVPLSARALTHVGGSELYVASGESYEIRVLSEDGSLIRIIRRENEARPVGEQDRQQYIDWYVGRMSRGPEGGSRTGADVRQRLESEAMWPDEFPPYSAMLTDEEGYLWVENYRWFSPLDVPQDPEPTRWSVFDPDGMWLGDVDIPGRLLLSSIAGEHVLGLWENEDGTSEVRMYALTRH